MTSPAVATESHSLNTPRALRVLQLSDRLVLHDVTFALRSKIPTDRNALVDAANQVHSRAPSTPPLLIDLSPAPPVSRPNSSRANRSSLSEKDNYLVLPFPAFNNPKVTAFEAFSAEEAGIASDNLISVEAAAGFLGLLRLHSGVFCVIASNIKQAGELPRGPIIAISRVKLFKLGGGPMSKEDREFATPIMKTLESGSLYYSMHCDLTVNSEKRLHSSPRVGNAFWWTYPMACNGGQTAVNWSLRTVYGFVGSSAMRFSSDALDNGSSEFQYTLISRRSRRRAGTRYITRGVDARGDVANFVESEQIVWSPIRRNIFSSFLIIRGSVPVFWRQNNGIARPSPELDSDLNASRQAFYSHFRNITKSYGEIGVVSLVDKHGSEGVLASAFERHFELDLQNFEQNRSAKLIAFDFHRHCAGKEYERGLAALLSRIRDDLGQFEFFTHGLEPYQLKKRQTGVFRVNCVDCLDRTNVVQSIIARVALTKQLGAIYIPEVKEVATGSSFRLYGDSEDRFKHVWGDNADQVSKQYSGTGALKTDFTRTGKRSTSGVIGDGMKSVMRMYYKNFVDEGRQESIDILCGNAVIKPLQALSSPGISGNTPKEASIFDELEFATSSNSSTPSKSVWYKFQAQRMNAGGDRQDVSIELGDTAMYLATPDGVCVDYPRQSLTSWERIEDGKPADRKAFVRLRLLFSPYSESAAAASPLDLIFRGGVIARENFLRAVLLWASPPVVERMGSHPIRLRCMAGLSVGDHKIAHWGLHQPLKVSREIVALVIPETYGSGRPWGLGAVPQDVDSSEYVLISAVSVPNGGPAIAILASKDIASTVMSVSEASTRRPPGAPGAPQGSGVAVSLIAGGTSMCFASLAVNGPEDLFNVVASLKLRNSVFDITNQFRHVCVAGTMGNLKWNKSNSNGPDSRRWVHLGDGSSCYSLSNGLSVMRNTFPSVQWNEILGPSSFWNSPTQAMQRGAKGHIVTLSDGITSGRPAPSIPKKMLQFVATLSNLCGKDIRTPPGVDTNIPLTTFVHVYSEYASAEPMGTKPTTRPSANPVWAEQVRLVFLPTDPEEIMSSFLLGQILIATPLSDTLVAGHFVVPMTCAGESGGEFNVPVRMAGISTGRLRGFLHIMPLNEGARGAISSLSLNDGSEIARAFSNLETRQPDQIGVIPPEISAPPSRSADSWNAWGANALPSTSSLSGFVPSGLPQRINTAEVTKNMDAARKKGTKQIKSVVSKLSSFMAQAPQPSPLPPRILNEPRTVQDGNSVGISSNSGMKPKPWADQY